MEYLLDDSEGRTSRPPGRARWGLVGWALLGALVLALLVYGCADTQTAPRSPSAPSVAIANTPGKVRTYGSIPALLQGDIAPKTSLAAVPSGPDVLAIGSLGDLRGEIATVRGVTWISYPSKSGGVTTERDEGSQSAAFLALAEVSHWREELLAQPVPLDHLGEVIEQSAARAGLDTSKPFPISIDGSFSDIELSVANGAALGGQKPTEERLRETSIKGSLPRGNGTIVGFFAAEGGERLVHPGQHFHLHVVLRDPRRAGHLESALIEPRALLRLPAMN